MKSNINPNTKKPWQIGEIRYPAYNDTSKWWKQARWDLITEVDTEGNIEHCYYMWSYETVKAVELIIILMTLKDFKGIIERAIKKIEERRK